MILRFDKGIEHVRRSIRAGDILAISTDFRNIGSVGMKAIEGATKNRCLQRVTRIISKLDANIALQLEKIETVHDAKTIVCNILNFKGHLLETCNK